MRAACVIRLRARLHADAREAALQLADRAAQRLDLVEQRRGGLREQRGLAGELALGLAEPCAVRRAASSPIASRRFWRVRARSRASVRRSWTRRSMRVRSNSSSPALDISASIALGLDAQVRLRLGHAHAVRGSITGSGTGSARRGSTIVGIDDRVVRDAERLAASRGAGVASDLASSSVAIGARHAARSDRSARAAARRRSALAGSATARRGSRAARR